VFLAILALLRRIHVKRSYLHFVPRAVSLVANATDVARIRVLLLERLSELVLLAVDVTLCLGSPLQVITVVLCRATITLVLVHWRTLESLVIRQWSRAFGFIASLFAGTKEFIRKKLMFPIN